MMQMTKEYATALFMLASEENRLNEVTESIEVVKTAFEDNPDFADLISSPAIPVSERFDMIEKAFSGIDEYVMSFLKLICEKRLANGILEIINVYEELFKEVKKISVAKVVSAVELDADEKDSIKNKLEKMCGHTVVLENTVDDTILGGIIIEMNDKVIDASLRNRLKEVKDVISK